jgi:uncharacterized protein YgbK (DUF1537 family)
MHNALPKGPLIAWYGDDFTGAAAVMEVLTFAGLPSVLFLEPPSALQLSRFGDTRCIGIASTARTKTPQWMRAELPAIFRRLAALQPQIVHYKVCSTLDSSPDVGSIGCAIDIGRKLFQNRWVPVLVAAPQMRRFQFYGDLYASAAEGVFRLDRHPVMAHHPVTPMNESNVAQHLSAQCNQDIGQIDLDALIDEETAQNKLNSQLAEDIHAFTIDCIDDRSEFAAGRLIWEGRDELQFVAGSQGIEFALVRYWRETGCIGERTQPVSVGRAKNMAVVSGSVSPTTAGQIAWAREHGFSCIRFDVTSACGSEHDLSAAEEKAYQSAAVALSEGRDPLVFTAEGSEDASVTELRKAIETTHSDGERVQQRIGEALGRVLNRLVATCDLNRAVISGGDTSGHATRQLGIFALTAIAETIPGAAICKAHSEGSMDGLELALKGGQMGSPDYFGWIRAGGGATNER